MTPVQRGDRGVQDHCGALLDLTAGLDTEHCSRLPVQSGDQQHLHGQAELTHLLRRLLHRQADEARAVDVDRVHDGDRGCRRLGLLGGV